MWDNAFSRQQSSITTRMRNLRDAPNMSATQSNDQRCFGIMVKSIGVYLGHACGPACTGPKALLSDRSDADSWSSSACLFAQAAVRCADSRSGDAWLRFPVGPYGSPGCRAGAFAALSVSGGISQEIFQHNVVKHPMRQQARQLAVLVF